MAQDLQDTQEEFDGVLSFDIESEEIQPTFEDIHQLNFSDDKELDSFLSDIDDL